MENIPRTLDDFYGLRESLDIQSVQDFYSCLEQGNVSWELELGTIFSLLNFNYGHSILDAYNENPEEYEFKRGVVVGRLQERYSFTSKSPISFLQTFRKRQFVDFVKKWQTEHGEQKHWNPVYARKEIFASKSIESFCRKNPLENVVSEFNIPGIVYREEQKERGKWSFNAEKEPSYLIFPFNGWSLAHYIQLSYEKRGKR